MKKIFQFWWLLLFLGGCTSTDINSPTDNNKGTEYKPVLMTRTALENSVTIQPARILSQAGKIYMRDSMLFISEKYKGIHIYDNKNPASPVNLIFISVPGCVDMAVKGNMIYADNAIDLVVIDISNVLSPQYIRRIKDVFPEVLPPDANTIPAQFQVDQRPANTVIVGWEKY